jgi:hypothetical protein
MRENARNGRRVAARAAIFGASWLALSCGYHALRGGAAGERYVVVLGTSYVADSTVASEVLAGTMRALSRGDRLGYRGEYPRVEVDILRVDEVADGVVGAAGAPRARGMRFSVLGRARVRASANEETSFDTGDLRAVVVASSDGPLVDAAWSRDRSLRAAAHRLGEKLGARVMGDPSVSEDTEGVYTEGR